MTSIVADKQDFQVNAGKITAFFNDMRNFKSIMPEQVERWQADENACSFSIKNLGNLGMRKDTFDPPHHFEFVANGGSKVDFTLVFHFSPDIEGRTNGYFEIIVEMNPLVEMMAKRPLTNFVNILTINFRQNMC